MVKIVDYRTYQNNDGEDFFALEVQGGIEAVKSRTTGRMYITARTARVACTFDEETCKSLIGTSLPGKIQKVEVEPYEYVIEETGEVIERSHRYELVDEVEGILSENIIEKETVI